MATSDHRHPSSIVITVQGGSVQVIVDIGNAPPYRVMLDRSSPTPAGEAPRGAFIATRSPFDVFAELARVVRAARREVLIVDPYVNATALTDIAIAAHEGVQIRILGDRAGTKGSLAPAASRWQAQYKTARPLEVRLARDRSLHDRLLLIDRTQVWNLSQSIADFARKSPASIERSGAAVEKEKAQAYLGLWTGATPLA